MRVLFVEPFFGGSHRAFAEGLRDHCGHDLALLTLPAGEWRSRMRRGAQELAAAAGRLEGDFDLLVATGMLDLPAFLALTRPRFERTPVLLYFHENQFTYPRLKGTKLNSWFGQINYLSACAAEAVAFNSAYHRDDFLAALEALRRQPNNWLVPEAIETIRAKSSVLPVGVGLAWLDAERCEADAVPLVLWNHRWEFDKAPEMFARVVERLAAEGLDFRLAIAGEPGDNPHPALATLPERLPAGRLAHFGYAAELRDYARLLWRSSIAVSTTRHEFFGVGMVEAMYCACVPLAPARYNYPALVPEGLHGLCLYETEERFEQQLRAFIRGPRPGPAAFRAAASQYAWPQVAPQWRAALESLVARG